MTDVGRAWHDSGMDTKRCAACKLEKSLEDFTSAPRYAQGVHSQCKNCINAARRARRNNPRDTRWDDNGRYCNDCDVYLPWSSFGINKRAATGYHYRCRTCTQVRSAVQRNKPGSREKRNAQTAAWKRANKEACIIHEGRRRAANRYTVSMRDLRRLRSRQSGKCLVCAEQLGSSAHLDHIIPVSRGGHHSIGNLQYLCSRCNMKKGARTMTEFKGVMW